MRTPVSVEIERGTIEFYPPTVGILKRAEEKGGSDISKTIHMIASCANMTEKEVEELELGDFMKLQKALQGFLERAGAIA